MGGLAEWVDGWSRRFVYYGMGGMGERDCILMGMGGMGDISRNA
jgi:hypothetical protein